MIEGRLFVDPAQHATTEEMKVKSNKILTDVRHLATVFLVMNPCTIDLGVSAMVAYVFSASIRRHRQQHWRKRFLARQECDDYVKF